MDTVAFQPNWRSLRAHRTPQWLQDAKFGIYTHWGVYSVPACGPNGTWYPYNMYREEKPLGDSYGVAGNQNLQYQHHVKTYGLPSTFGYKDFIPLFTGDRFDADEWAELFKQAGARFAGPVGEHHDGFAMWDSALTEWNATRMGPKRDVVRALEKAIRAQGLRFMVALHHAENWWFFPHWRQEFDTADPRYAGLYGPPHNVDGYFGAPRDAADTSWPFYDQDPPNKAFLDLWKAKIIEVIDGTGPTCCGLTPPWNGSRSTTSRSSSPTTTTARARGARRWPSRTNTMPWCPAPRW